MCCLFTDNVSAAFNTICNLVLRKYGDNKIAQKFPLDFTEILIEVESEEKYQFDGDEDDRFPKPYIFKPPSPPGDLAVAPRVQVRASVKKIDSEDEVNCQYCGRKLTKEEQLTHSCKKKPE